MKLQLIAVGTRMPDWVTRGFEEYHRRFPRDMALELIEIPAGKRGKNADIARILQKEGEILTLRESIHQLEKVRMRVTLFASVLKAVRCRYICVFQNSRALKTQSVWNTRLLMWQL